MRFAKLEKLRAGRGDMLQHRNGLDIDRRGEHQRFAGRYSESAPDGTAGCAAGAIPGSLWPL